jgi:hypothetical protein
MSLKSYLKAFIVSSLLLVTIASAQTGEQVAAPPTAAPSTVTVPDNDKAGDKIVVDVWSAALPSAAAQKETDPAKLSPSFAATALGAASRIQFTQSRITNSIRMGFPLGGGFWIRTDLDAIDESLRVATLTATNEADRQTLWQLQNQTDRLRVWCEWLIDQNRNLRLANYFISPEPLDNDENYQNIATCTRFLLSMVATGRLEQVDRSCR